MAVPSMDQLLEDASLAAAMAEAYVASKGAELEASAECRAIGDMLKQYMQLEGLDRLANESGRDLLLTERALGAKYDLVRLADLPDTLMQLLQREAPGVEAIVRAALNGWLSVDDQAVKRYRANAGSVWADRLWATRDGGGTTQALIIEQRK